MAQISEASYTTQLGAHAHHVSVSVFLFACVLQIPLHIFQSFITVFMYESFEPLEMHVCAYVHIKLLLKLTNFAAGECTSLPLFYSPLASC